MLLVSQSNNANPATKTRVVLVTKQFWRLFEANEGKSSIDKNMCEPSNIFPSPNYYYIYLRVDTHFSETLIILAFLNKGCQLNAKWLSNE